MNEVLEFVEELKQLKDLNNDTTVDVKLNRLIEKYEKEVEVFESQLDFFFGDTPFDSKVGK